MEALLVKQTGELKTAKYSCSLGSLETSAGVNSKMATQPDGCATPPGEATTNTLQMEDSGTWTLGNVSYGRIG